ncbi:AI-2E family transporter [Salsuginibacillus kocurii]|uniref:AI-2E family transporter n=1 Tax=Salsuginibacillus kocurii TaxID=427078 RepID=UPI000368A3BA|nr:AI-2E family transporter [Salsuginibacillus kocurii]
MIQSTWFRFLASVVLILLAINLAVMVPFIFHPISVAISALAPVLIIGGVLYYILRPLVNWMKIKMPVPLAILIIFGLFSGIVALIVMFAGPIFMAQINHLIDNIPQFVNDTQEWIDQVLESEWVRYIEEEANLQDIDASMITDQMSGFLSNIGANVMNFFSIIFSVIMVIVVLPFVLFFLLKDAHKLPDNILYFLPSDQKDEGRRILHDMDETLSAYIQGQAIVSVCVGILSLIAYLIIGIDYPMVLALIAMFTNLIPFIGPFIGTIPAVIVALFQDPLLALWVILAIVIIQQIESNLISPNVMGHKLRVHPLTIILLLILAGNLAGVIGLILAIPAYAVSKVILSNVYRLLRLRYPKLR